MSGRLEGKVALITGAAHGQGRSHAIRLAEEGADIIAVDICESIASAPYPMGTAEELAETAAAVIGTGRRIVTRKVDVRDQAGLGAAVQQGVAELGRLDIVAASAGIFHNASFVEMTDAEWHEMVDVNLHGVYNTLKVSVPYLVDQGAGGSIVITSSAGGVRSWPNMAHYCSTKHAVIGLMLSLANELGPHGIRVNCVAPTTVDTPMIQNEVTWAGVGVRDSEEFGALYKGQHLLPFPWVEARDISNAVLWLASEEGRHVTGVTLPVDLGVLQKTTA
ncbi:mycofactocin-coupled SDR family oxidoreductase [Pseudonocardia nematodicida]|uniref:Mycofactocin-coupled SDR family oxidoreductase n=1 Tax=Pseudonocardia nematodicida TaxID=1206997 RepID=A0ABV1KAB0_9PSEU